jgi:hypothetical protein
MDKANHGTEVLLPWVGYGCKLHQVTFVEKSYLR